MKPASAVTAVLIPLLLAAIWTGVGLYRPGGAKNPHEWLNEVMRKEKGDTSAQLGHWRLEDPSQSFHSPFTVTDLELHLAVVSASAADYAMLQITVPDGRCFVADYCLRHGEFVMRPCAAGHTK